MEEPAKLVPYALGMEGREERREGVDLPLGGMAGVEKSVRDRAGDLLLLVLLDQPPVMVPAAAYEIVFLQPGVELVLP